MTAPPRPARRRRAQRGSGEQLRAEIITATKSLLAETGKADAVSIRAVADRVGVTAPSIYLHFADKDALLDAVVTDVFTELDTVMAKAEAEVTGTSPLARLRAQGLAYIRFAVGHPEHYRVATMEPCATPPEVDAVLASACFARFTATIAQCQAAGVFGGDDPLPIALDLWSTAHGLASLMIAKPYLPWGDLEVIADRQLRTTALGHALNDVVGADADPDAMAAWVGELKRTR